jgi:DNA repair protein RadC
VLAADPDALAAAAGDAGAAAHLRTVAATMHHVLHDNLDRGPIIGNGRQLIDYLTGVGSFSQIEEVRVLFLNARYELIRDDLMASGCTTEAPIYVRRIVKRALDLGATAMIVAHNHPSGDPTPSAADADATRQLGNAARSVGIELVDHLILARGHWVSLRDHGLV